MRKQEVDQLQGNHSALKCLCFPCIYGTIPLLPKAEIQATAGFVSDLDRNPIERFSQDAAQMLHINQMILTFWINRPFLKQKVQTQISLLLRSHIIKVFILSASFRVELS